MLNIKTDTQENAEKLTLLDKQYRKGLITLHEFLIRSWFFGGSISEQEMNDCLADIADCMEAIRIKLT